MMELLILMPPRARNREGWLPVVKRMIALAVSRLTLGRDEFVANMKPLASRFERIHILQN